ncbi:acyl-CoA dehydrogenase family protein [Chitinivorax sp. PXF-14]|uniref:acyl-CoA dehydrogenase family protein n=1 Tax=Chitinivorax sp. PXF-14 TaxID=3230488 RepID=UPI003464ECE2
MDSEDTKQLLEATGRFAAERIAGMAERPEHPASAAQLASLTQEAAELGILSQSTAEAGFAIWEDSGDAHAMRFNLGALQQIAAACPGVALAWHRQALARHVAVQLGLAIGEQDLRTLTLMPTGHYGLARTSLARWLAGAGLTAEDGALLSDWLDRSNHPPVLCAPADWSGLIWPVWRAGRIAWHYAARTALAVNIGKPQHGFDELAGFEVSLPGVAGETVELEPARSRQLYAQVLKMELLGLLAIGAGALDRGQALARDYVAIRRQGGKLIAEHPAVQQMLSDIEITRTQASMALRMCSVTVDELDLGELMASRASISPMLCHAANQVVQIHGGIGYMRDAGPEKLVRDQNMLRLMSGGIRDIPLFLAAWTGARQ